MPQKNVDLDVDVNLNLNATLDVDPYAELSKTQIASIREPRSAV